MLRFDKTGLAMGHLIQESSQMERKNEPSPNVTVVLETLLDSARALSNEPALSHALVSINQIPALEAKIRRQKAQEEVAKSVRQQALDDYATQRDNWKAEKQQFQTRVETLEKFLLQEKSKVESLEANGGQQSKRISSLEESLAKSSLNEQSSQKKIQGLIKAIESERQKCRTLDEDLRQTATKADQAHSEKDEIQKAYEKAQKQANWYELKLETAASLTVPVVDDASVIDGVDTMWRRVASIVCSKFYRNVDLNDPKTKAFWTTYEQKSGLSDVLPLPQSNSEAAIQALLQAMQEKAIDERTEVACNAIATLTNGLLPGHEDMQYRSQLKSLAEEASQVWRAICCFTDTIEPRFDTRRHENWSDGEYVFEEKQFHIRDQGRINTDTADEPIVAVFPRLYAIYEGVSVLETSGVFWMRTQAKASQDELEKIPLTARVGRVHSKQQRAKAQRRSAGMSRDQASAASRSVLDPRSDTTDGSGHPSSYFEIEDQ
ncbi:hypothetical protein KC338_g8835 [Hortaea werneckii]|nr:hypothetical protein KC338_g8835 [Hortaea werneckii]KAI7069914.1 hypothetical protein KC339_g14702 [Hortaea werneckii]KAI7224185.1 hypothetical protein KC365_g10900 [Hortaea werneckii]